jgi:hypothetical protein
MDDELNKDIELKNEDENKEKENKKGSEKKEDKSIDVEALKKALETEITERVRKEEKAKLYESFEKYKKDAKEAIDEKESIEIKLKEYETKNLSADEQTALKLQSAEESIVQLRTQLTDIVEQANSKITTLQMELMKKDLLAKYGEEIIPSMVSGNTLDELMESAENAHREYVNITEKFSAKSKEAKLKETIGTNLGPSSDRLNVSPSIADIKKMNDPNKWEELKAKLLEEAFKPN